MTPYDIIEQDGDELYLMEDETRKICGTITGATPEVVQLLEVIPELVVTLQGAYGVLFHAHHPMNRSEELVTGALDIVIPKLEQALAKAGIS